MNRSAAFSVRAARLLALACIVAFAGGCASLPFMKPKPIETGYLKRTFEGKQNGKTRTYAVYVPASYNDSRRDWPVMFFLHGMGERGDDIDLVLKHGPMKEALAKKDFPFIVVAPQVPRPETGEGNFKYTWNNAEEDITTVIDQTKAEFRIDETRMYLTGLSMGGFGSFAYAAKHPGVFAAVVPICGGGDAAVADKYKGTPFWIFHGEKDSVVPVNRSVEMADAMKAMGVDVKLTLYPEANHDSWTETYANEEVYSWMLSHRLPKKK